MTPLVAANLTSRRTCTLHSLRGGWLPREGPFDEPFPFGLLTMIVSPEEIFLSTFVMISQNRPDLHREVLADHEWQLVQ